MKICMSTAGWCRLTSLLFIRTDYRYLYLLHWLTDYFFNLLFCNINKILLFLRIRALLLEAISTFVVAPMAARWQFILTVKFENINRQNAWRKAGQPDVRFSFVQHSAFESHTTLFQTPCRLERTSCRLPKREQPRPAPALSLSQAEKHTNKQWLINTWSLVGQLNMGTHIRSGASWILSWCSFAWAP